MLGIQTELKLANLLKAISDSERQIEDCRQDLAELVDFEPYTAFKRIDRLSTSYLTTYNIQRFLRENDIFVSERDVNNFIKSYDVDKDGRLSYTEFLNMILPNANQGLRTRCTARRSYYIGRYEALPYKTEWSLARVFNKEIDCFRKIQLLKDDLLARYDWNAMDAFKLIDVERFGYLHHESLYYFLKRNDIIVNDNDIIALLRRIDILGVGKINFSTFVEIIESSEPIDRTTQLRASMIENSRQRSASPARKTLTTSFYSPSKKTSNLDYLEYVNESSKKSPIRQNNNEDIPLARSSVYATPTRRSGSRYSSPIRESASSKRSRSPMKGNEEEHLAIALKQQIDSERDLENTKNELALKSDFNLLDIFRFFDIIGKGHVTKFEFESGMKYFSVFPNSNELNLLMKKYDVDHDTLLRYNEFCDMIVPKAEEYANILTNRVPTYARDENLDIVWNLFIDNIFSYETKKAFTLLLNKLIVNEVNAEALRQKLNRRPLFNIFEAFKALDKNEMGYLGIEEFKELLLNHGMYASSKDIVNLVARYDQNQDGKVSYSEFIQEITPKSPTRIYQEKIDLIDLF